MKNLFICLNLISFLIFNSSLFCCDEDRNLIDRNLGLNGPNEQIKKPYLEILKLKKLDPIFFTQKRNHSCVPAVDVTHKDGSMFYKILLVEDNIIFQKVNLAFLRKYNHSVDLAVNGKEALEYASTNPYNLILMDIMMPVMNGIEATKELKKNQLTQHIPIVAYTTTITSDVILQAFAAGCCEVVEKGHQDPKLLLDLINRLKIHQFIECGSTSHNWMINNPKITLQSENFMSKKSSLIP